MSDSRVGCEKKRWAVVIVMDSDSVLLALYTTRCATLQTVVEFESRR